MPHGSITLLLLFALAPNNIDNTDGITVAPSPSVTSVRAAVSSRHTTTNQRDIHTVHRLLYFYLFLLFSLVRERSALGLSFFFFFFFSRLATRNTPSAWQSSVARTPSPTSQPTQPATNDHTVRLLCCCCCDVLYALYSLQFRPDDNNDTTSNNNYTKAHHQHH